MSSKIRFATAAVCGALLTAACTGGGGGVDASSTSPLPESTSPTASPPEEPTAAPSWGGVNVAVKYDQPGFNFRDDGTARSGFENDLALFLKRALGFKGMAYSDVPSKDREKVLVEGTADLVIATYSITADREKKIDFAGPYLQTRQGLLVRKGDRSIKEIKDTADKVVCTVEGSTSDGNASVPSIRKQLRTLMPEAVVDLRTDYSDCVARLEAGEVHAVWTDLAVLYGFMEHHKGVEVVENLEIGSPQRYGIGVQEGREEQCRQIAEKLRDFLNSPDWGGYFKYHFSGLAGRDPEFEQKHKPNPEDIDKYSCLDD
ncbi:transporter substrate-binding domain-containing protein [Streptomyces sp. URMC 125]|uniref:transporter substrate-binding domain-containing protein n=1 Tax=Streptomyces sp. URMC 125 TaxID=3423419 RepID=UPI003F1BD7EC